MSAIKVTDCVDGSEIENVTHCHELVIDVDSGELQLLNLDGNVIKTLSITGFQDDVVEIKAVCASGGC